VGLVTTTHPHAAPIMSSDTSSPSTPTSSPSTPTSSPATAQSLLLDFACCVHAPNEYTPSTVRTVVDPHVLRVLHEHARLKSRSAEDTSDDDDNGSTTSVDTLATVGWHTFADKNQGPRVKLVVDSAKNSVTVLLHRPPTSYNGKANPSSYGWVPCAIHDLHCSEKMLHEVLAWMLLSLCVPKDHFHLKNVPSMVKAIRSANRVRIRVFARFFPF
jgi:hypothetical protein